MEIINIRGMTNEQIEEARHNLHAELVQLSKRHKELDNKLSKGRRYMGPRKRKNKTVRIKDVNFQTQRRNNRKAKRDALTCKNHEGTNKSKDKKMKLFKYKSTDRGKIKIIYKPKDHDITEDLLYRGSGFGVL